MPFKNPSADLWQRLRPNHPEWTGRSRGVVSPAPRPHDR